MIHIMKKILISGCLMLLSGCQVLMDYDPVLGAEAGDVIVTKDEVVNLVAFETFYNHVTSQTEGEVNLAIETTFGYEHFELVTEEGVIKLYTDVMRTDSRFTQYKIKIFSEMKKTLKQGVVTYVLVNEFEEYEMLSYRMS